MMKKITLISAVFALAGFSLFGQETKEFNKVLYESEFISEFNSWEEFRNQWLPENWWFKDGGVGIDIFSLEGDKSEFYKEDGTLKWGNSVDAIWAGKDTYEVKDGILGMKYSFWKTPLDNEYNGHCYHVRKGEISRGTWPNSLRENETGMMEGREPLENYYLKIDRKVLIETKFKVPRSPAAFEVFMISKDSSFNGNTDIEKFRNEKGVYFDEIDFIELKTDGLGQDNLAGLQKNHVEYQGGLHITEPNGQLLTGIRANDGYDSIDGMRFQKGTNDAWPTIGKHTYVKNTEQWCNEWHTLDVELTQTSMVTYIDGKKFHTFKWGKTSGEIPSDQEWNFVIFPKSFDCWTNKLDWDEGGDYTFYLDYVKVYKETGYNKQ